jgi:hypothetical protein
LLIIKIDPQAAKNLSATIVDPSAAREVIARETGNTAFTVNTLVFYRRTSTEFDALAGKLKVCLHEQWFFVSLCVAQQR